MGNPSVSGVAADFSLRPGSLGTQTKVCGYNLRHPSPRGYPPGETFYEAIKKIGQGNFPLPYFGDSQIDYHLKVKSQ